MNLDNVTQVCYTTPIRGDNMNQIGLEPLVQLNIRMDRQDKEALQILAQKDRRTLSDYIRLVLENHVKEKGLSTRGE